MVQIFKQSLEQIQRYRRYRVTQFWTQNQDQIYTSDPNEHFLENFINGIVFYLLFFNVMLNLKKSLERIQRYSTRYKTLQTNIQADRLMIISFSTLRPMTISLSTLLKPMTQQVFRLKKHVEILFFGTSVPKIMIIICTSLHEIFWHQIFTTF